MTYNDLQSEILLLGGGLTLPDSRTFAANVNQALRRLYTDRLIERRVRIVSRPITPVSYYKEIQVKNGKLVDIPLNGVAFSMRVHGKGRYRVLDGEAVDMGVIDSMNGTIVIKRFLSYGGTLSLWGSFTFAVYDLAVYDQTFSENKEDIPEYGSTKIYDLREMYGDYMAFTSSAEDSDGEPIKNCKLIDGRIEIDPDYSGEIILSYRRLPNEILITDDEDSDAEQIIDVPEEYRLLYLELLASYCFLQDDEVLAKYYREQYEKSIERLNVQCYTRIDPVYVNTNGWA